MVRQSWRTSIRKRAGRQSIQQRQLDAALTLPIVRWAVHELAFDQTAFFRLGEHDGMQRAWVEVNGKVLREFVFEHGPLEGFKVVLTRD